MSSAVFQKYFVFNYTMILRISDYICFVDMFWQMLETAKNGSEI